MKTLIVLFFAASLVSCNTSIGIYRDTKAGFLWTKGKIQQWSGDGAPDEEYGAPVY